MNTAKKTRKFTHSCYFHKCNEILHLIVECHCSGNEESKESVKKEEESTARRVSFNKVQEGVPMRPRRPSRDPVALNWTLMEKYLKDESSPHRGKLLQAIRWRLTGNVGLGAKTAQEVAKSDFLGVRKFTGKVLEALLWAPEKRKETHHLQTSTARFLNALTSYAEGVEYLSRASVVKSLTFGEQFALISLNRQFVDSHTAGQLLATMRRLSERPEIAKEMLSRNFLIWIIEYLEEIEYSGGEYQIREGLSLLAELIKYPEAFSEELFARAAQFLALLARYANRTNAYHTQKIHSIASHLLKNPEVAKIAKLMDFEKILTKGPDTKIPSSGKQIDPEIDINDPISELPGLEGEIFLEEHFAEIRESVENGTIGKGDEVKTPEKSSHIPVRVEKSGNKKDEKVSKKPPRRLSKKDILSDSDPEIAQALSAIFPGNGEAGD